MKNTGQEMYVLITEYYPIQHELNSEQCKKYTNKKIQRNFSNKTMRVGVAIN